MSAESQPISPARFAEALIELPASSLALKVLELRNSIAHLDYANEELKPFAEGRVPVMGAEENIEGAGTGTPDQDCIDAIKENEGVIERMQQRIELVRVEVEGRGLSWREFQGKADDDEVTTAEANTNGTPGDATSAAAPTTNGVNGHASESGDAQHAAWRDGTFQTGTIRGLGDEELLRQLQSRMPADDGDGNDEDPDIGGMHL